GLATAPGAMDVERLSGCAHPPRAQDLQRRLFENVAVIDLRYELVRLGKAAHRQGHTGKAEALERNFYLCPFHKHSLKTRDALKASLGSCAQAAKRSPSCATRRTRSLIHCGLRSSSAA